jgi:hypothetical protein
MCKSEAQLAWCFLQTLYYWNSTTTSSKCYRKNSNPQIRSTKKIALKIFLKGCRSSWLFKSPDDNSGEFYLIIHSDQTNKLNKAWAVTFLILSALLSLKVTPRQTHFSLWHLLKKGSCAKLYAILWQKVEYMFVELVSSISIHQIWIPSTSDSQLKNSFPLYRCDLVSKSRKNEFSHCLKSWESLGCKENNHFLSRTCISVFGSLEIPLELIWDQC